MMEPIIQEVTIRSIREATSWKHSLDLDDTGAKLCTTATERSKNFPQFDSGVDGAEGRTNNGSRERAMGNQWLLPPNELRVKVEGGVGREIEHWRRRQQRRKEMDRSNANDVQHCTRNILYFD